MGGKKHSGPYGMKAYEWEFPVSAKIWKIVYNPEYKQLPACITVFTKKNTDHGAVQAALDVLFPENMGRGGANALGDSHSDLHSWISEPTNMAAEHPHDHFIIGGRYVNEHHRAITLAVAALVGTRYIGDFAYDVIQYLQKGV